MKTLRVGLPLIVSSLLFLGCAGGGASQPDGLLPQNVQDEIISHYFAPENNRNVQIEVTGESTVLPHEQTRGVDKAVCLKIRYEEKLAPDRWAQGVSSRIVQRQGDDWIVNDALLWVERAWNLHSCPGTYELLTPQ
jgi:hypothetical protein